MPNYGRYSDPADQYQGTAFNPYTGRLNGAQLVMQFMSRQKQAKEEADKTAWEQMVRELERENYELGIKGKKLDITQKEREARDYATPDSPAMAEFKKRMDEKRAHKRRIEEIEAQGKKEKEVAEARGAGVEKPSDYDKKVAEAKRLHKLGKLTDQELSRVTTGYSGEETEKDRKATRYRIAGETRKAIDAGIANEYHKNPKDRETMKSALGVDLTMPHEYNISKRMMEADVADDSDYDTIKKYEDLQRFYQEQLKPSMSLKQLMASEFYKGLDEKLKAELVKWYRLKL